MFRKILNYQHMLCDSLSKNTWGGKWYVLFLFMIIIFTIFSDYEMSAWSWMWLALCCLGISVIENSSSKMLKTLPVSDAFAVANMMYVFPLYIGSLSCIGIIVVCGVLQYVFEGKLSVFLGIRDIDIMGCIFSLMIACGIWFWLSLGAFHKNTKIRKIWYFAIYIICIAALQIVSEVLQSMGIYVNFALADLPEVFPAVPMLLVGAAFAVVSGMIAWCGSIRLYRADIKGQAKSIDMQDKKDEQFIADAMELKTKTGKYRRNMGLAVVAGIIGISLFSLMAALGGSVDSDDGQKVDITTSNPAEYSEWDSYAQEMDMDEEFWETGETIFPKQMDEKYIEEYFVKVNGSFQKESWAAVSSLRFMVADLPEKEYQKEKQRIAGISVTCSDEAAKNKVNSILHDTEHFPLEAYIAVYEEDLEYEYALTDDENKRIIYLFAYDTDLEDIPTAVDFQAKNGMEVISILQANTNAKGFSVYSFWDEEIEVYFMDTPMYQK